LATKPMEEYIREESPKLDEPTTTRLAQIIKPIYMKIMFCDANLFVCHVLKKLPDLLNGYELRTAIISDHIDDHNKQRFIIHVIRAFLIDRNNFDASRELFKIEE
jgi:hypothetical protein